MSTLPPEDSRSDNLRERAEWMIARVEGDSPTEAAGLVEELRNARLYAPLLRLAEAIVRKRPDEHRVRRLYAQGLIEQGQVTAAIDVLERLAARLPKGHPERREATGLIGRAYKQMFFDARDPHSPGARAALQAAIRAYRRPFEQDPPSTWHGVNLVALLACAQRRGLPLPRGMKVDAIARRLMAALDTVAPQDRDEWHHATRAETALALRDWPTVQLALQAYIATPTAKAFMIQSTLRQFTQVWELDKDTGGPGPELVGLLQARLLAVSEGVVQLSTDGLKQARQQPQPQAGLLQAVLGEDGAKTWTWWKTGLERAAAVGVVRSRMGVRLGTGWLVNAAALGLPVDQDAKEDQIVVTNFHVVNPDGSHNGLTPDQAELVFEAVDSNRGYAVQSLIWSSPPERHDVALLRLEAQIPGVKPLPLAKRLPLVESTARVYIIGHPGGRGLAFSLQDNTLIGHEGPDAGKPTIPGVCRVHYRAPTEGGSSGSPVFNAFDWAVIALHHSGGKLGMPMLNGQPGTYAANEGISIQSIRDAIAEWQSSGGSA